jgi:RND superfamily putative drug exporter
MRVLRRPALAGGVVVALLLAVSAPALGLETGPPSPLTLPGDSAARKDFDVIDHAIGGSRTTPFVVTVVARHGTLAGARRAALAGFERRVQGDPRTLAVLAVDPRPARAARILVVQRKLPTRAGNPYRGYLEQQAALLGRQTGSATAVGGPAASLADFDDAAKGNLPLLMVMLVVVTYAGLVPLMRSLVLPLIAVVLNVLTVLAAFGVLALAFGPSHPLGGPGFVDDIMVDIVFSVVLALSIDYQIFILDRMREGYVATGTVEGAIAYGLQHTAGVITGAAAIMLAVFLAFAISPVVTMSELGLGLSVAVALDATLVRLVLLPAALRLAGPRAWGWPAAFDRLAGRPRQSARAT